MIERNGAGREEVAAVVRGVGVVHGLGDGEALCGLRRSGATPALEGALPPPDVGPLAEALPGVSLRRMPRYARMGLLAAARALADAGDSEASEAGRTALVIGTAWAGVRMSMDFMDSILDSGPRLSSPTAFSHAVNNMGAGLLSLALGLRGPCCTVTQFDLSFAGALGVAAALLREERAERVLVGAIDETDPRFSKACPRIAAENRALAEGAVFLLLAADGPDIAPSVTVAWNPSVPPGLPVLASGAAEAPGAARYDALYGRAPLAQALDVVLGLDMLSPQTPQIVCLCADAGTGRRAAIHLRRTPL